MIKFDYQKAKDKLQFLAKIPNDWDGRNSPPIHPNIITSVQNFLEEIKDKNDFDYNGMVASADGSIMLYLTKGEAKYTYEFDEDSKGLMISEKGKKSQFFDL